VTVEAADAHIGAPEAGGGVGEPPLSPALRRYAMSLLLAISMIMAVFTAILFWMPCRTLREDLET
jgi:hypothetical protein